MAGTTLITRYMNAPLPNKTEQRKLPFRPSTYEVDALYNSINRHIFDNVLTEPEILLGQWPQVWGSCSWEEKRQRRGSHGKLGTWCRMRLSDKWYSPQWFCAILAHEMVHQYQWDIDRWIYRDEMGRDPCQRSGAHGPSFHEWKPALEELGIPLKLSFGRRRWFQTQDLHRC